MAMVKSDIEILTEIIEQWIDKYGLSGTGKPMKWRKRNTMMVLLLILREHLKKHELEK